MVRSKFHHICFNLKSYQGCFQAYHAQINRTAHGVVSMVLNKAIYFFDKSPWLDNFKINMDLLTFIWIKEQNTDLT